MASLLQSSTLLSNSSSSSLTFVLPYTIHKIRNSSLQPLKLIPSQPHTLTTSPLKRSDHSKGTLIRSTILCEGPVLDPPPTEPDLVASLKLKLLNVVSGLNRGLAASEEDLRKADAAAKELESVGGLVDLSTDLDKLQGRWKLIYSSAFSSRTLGGSRPGPPVGRLPVTLGQVFQRIDILSKDFDNIVELQLGAPWPLPPVEVTATLAHKFELIGSAKVKIIFEKTTVKTTGNLSQLPPFEVPRIPDSLRPSSNTGITRGDRDELRVFVIS
ncbi:PREDICTED: probable plastid-lipid-associated protein 6, chloroplastic [Nelumbo nucifera]|uniref:Plastid lipid-associated protein/fibrillin conserved domain-containing protein n=2 Tax=Nelumbo nucifera TaxID=4432 RepID=A0A822YZE7_NELNU|nr:PREDICTED: probable plastid-lipid-associated protein 6, chloroplastic [Nelumbo nucifera]DAD36831.1 TPA_asm: hypothetical protein HUJ06_007472 [Nelumbo nucifera]